MRFGGNLFYPCFICMLHHVWSNCVSLVSVKILNDDIYKTINIPWLYCNRAECPSNAGLAALKATPLPQKRCVPMNRELEVYVSSEMTPYYLWEVPTPISCILEGFSSLLVPAWGLNKVKIIIMLHFFSFTEGKLN